MTKAPFWIAFVLILTAALFFGLRHEIERSHKELEAKLLAAVAGGGQITSSSSPKDAAGSSAAKTTADTEGTLKALEDASDKIPMLATVPDVQRKEKEIAERAEKELLQMGTKGFAPVEARFQKPGSYEFRRRLLKLLGKIDGDRAFRVAENAFNREGEDYNIRWAAAAVMRELDGAKTLDTVGEFLVRHTGHQHPGMSYLVDTLAEIGGHEVIVTLIQVMLDLQKELSVRNAAVRALGELRAKEAYPQLQDMVATNPNNYFRINAARALLQIDDREGCDYLREILRQEKSDDYRQFLEQLLRDRCPS